MKNSTLGLLTILLILVAGRSAGQRGQECITANDGPGTCMAVSECQEIRNLTRLIQSGIAPPGSRELLRNSICRVGDREILVCCSEPPVPVQPANVQPENSRNGSSLPENCGIQPIRNKIARGEAPLRAWPWIVLLRGFQNSTRTSIWFCQGTLISSRYVLSGAACFSLISGITLEYVRIGEHNLASESDCDQLGCAPTPQDITVKRVISHPEFGIPCVACNDIALLELSQEAVIDSQYVTPICLPVNPVRDMGFSALFFRGKIGLIAGWGDTAIDPGTIQRPDVLHESEIPIQDRAFCQSLKQKYPDKDSVICAGGDGTDSCGGDSGGPLTLTNDKATKHFLIGIVSLGPAVCGAPGTQGLYTSVHHYIPWILSVLESEG